MNTHNHQIGFKLSFDDIHQFEPDYTVTPQFVSIQINTPPKKQPNHFTNLKQKQSFNLSDNNERAEIKTVPNTNKNSERIPHSFQGNLCKSSQSQMNLSFRRSTSKSIFTQRLLKSQKLKGGLSFFPCHKTIKNRQNRQSSVLKREMKSQSLFQIKAKQKLQNISFLQQRKPNKINLSEIKTFNQNCSLPKSVRSLKLIKSPQQIFQNLSSKVVNGSKGSNSKGNPWFNKKVQVSQEKAKQKLKLELDLISSKSNETSLESYLKHSKNLFHHQNRILKNKMQNLTSILNRTKLQKYGSQN